MSNRPHRRPHTGVRDTQLRTDRTYRLAVAIAEGVDDVDDAKRETEAQIRKHVRARIRSKVTHRQAMGQEVPGLLDALRREKGMDQEAVERIATRWEAEGGIVIVGIAEITA